MDPRLRGVVSGNAGNDGFKADNTVRRDVTRLYL
jgi:hypothetical protein